MVFDPRLIIIVYSCGLLQLFFVKLLLFIMSGRNFLNDRVHMIKNTFSHERNKISPKDLNVVYRETISAMKRSPNTTLFKKPNKDVPCYNNDYIRNAAVFLKCYSHICE